MENLDGGSVIFFRLGGRRVPSGSFVAFLEEVVKTVKRLEVSDLTYS